MKSDWLRKPLKVDGRPGRIVNSMQMEMSSAKSPNKVCVLQRFTCCLPHSLGCLLPACPDRQFRHQIVFLLHTIQHTHASQMHMISQIKCVFTKIYFNRFPKGGTSRRPLVLEAFEKKSFAGSRTWVACETCVPLHR